MGIDPNLKDMVSEDHLRVSDQKLSSWEEKSGAKLGLVVYLTSWVTSFAGQRVCVRDLSSGGRTLPNSGYL